MLSRVDGLLTAVEAVVELGLQQQAVHEAGGGLRTLSFLTLAWESIRTRYGNRSAIFAEYSIPVRSNRISVHNPNLSLCSCHTYLALLASAPY